METTKKNNETTICGHVIQFDDSGVGHNWKTMDASTLPYDVREAIAAEIVDGKREGDEEVICGMHYRWLA